MQTADTDPEGIRSCRAALADKLCERAQARHSWCHMTKRQSSTSSVCAAGEVTHLVTGLHRSVTYGDQDVALAGTRRTNNGQIVRESIAGWPGSQPWPAGWRRPTHRNPQGF